MCCLIYASKGTVVPEDHISEAWRMNPHGGGFAWIDPNKEGGVWYSKRHMDLNAFKHNLKDVKDTPLIMHFRIASVGKRIPENTHPFVIGKGLSGWVMAHNGTIPDMDLRGDESDTSAFARDVLGPLMDNNPNQIFDPDTKRTLEERIKGSKMVLMGPKGQHVILNEGLGHWKDGIWYSNYSYVPVIHTARVWPGGGEWGWGNENWTPEQWSEYFKREDKLSEARVAEAHKRSYQTYESSKNGNWFRVHSVVNAIKTTGDWQMTQAFKLKKERGEASSADLFIQTEDTKDDWKEHRKEQKKRNRALRAIQKDVRSGEVDEVKGNGCLCEECGSVMEKEETAYHYPNEGIYCCRECTIGLFMMYDGAQSFDMFQTHEEVEDFLQEQDKVDPGTEESLGKIPDLSEKETTYAPEDLAAQELEEQERIMGVARHAVS